MTDLDVFINVAGVAVNSIGGVGADVQAQGAVAQERGENRVGIGGIALAAVAEIFQRGLGDGVGVFPSDKPTKGRSTPTLT